ncbi:hypothetical protein N7519_009151 [Penicillium mononematosum]|uniref:uncharacterized protein n=1 Tax=Penicillium mononematosum TaxID=268346 RepID=UPI002547FB98|nr:uncharacterized protein N7519_009151 [Penicillium mononematosum]KAJ6178690.1 hypothetical protein N7519_009151 [Penicillium mononematosum]
MAEGSPIRSLNDTELEILMEIRYQDIERAAARDEILQGFWDLIAAYQEFRAFGFYLVSPYNAYILFILFNRRMEELNEAMVVLDGQENSDNQIFGLVWEEISNENSLSTSCIRSS